jgi:hypothetical protein
MLKGIGRLHTNLRERVRVPGETETYEWFP